MSFPPTRVRSVKAQIIRGSDGNEPCGSEDEPCESGDALGLAEFEIYEANPPETLPFLPTDNQPRAPFTVGFDDQPNGLLEGEREGLDFGKSDWTVGNSTEDPYLYIDFPRSELGQPATAQRMIILPEGTTLASIDIACPPETTVALSQVGAPMFVASGPDCNSTLKRFETSWGENILSRIVHVWVDLSATEASLPSVIFDNIKVIPVETANDGGERDSSPLEEVSEEASVDIAEAVEAIPSQP